MGCNTKRSQEPTYKINKNGAKRFREPTITIAKLGEK